MISTTISSSASTATSDAGPGRSASLRWAKWTRRHPRPAMAGWVMLLVASMAVGGWSEVRLASTHPIAGEAGRPVSVAAGNTSGIATGTVVVRGRGRLSAATVAAVRSDLAISMSRVPGVDAVGAPVVSADGSSAVVTVRLNSADAAAVRGVLRRVSARHPGLDVSITGSTAAAALAA